MAVASKKNKTFFENVVEIILLLAVVFLIRTWGFGLYQVPTGSMETTMLVGERFFADKLSYVFRDPARGEVIAFNEPPAFFSYSKNPLKYLFQKYVYGPSNWTKRVIGIPGDTIQGVIEDDKPVIYVNNKKLDEPYLNKYPLIRVYKEDPRELQRQIKAEFSPLLWRGVDEHVVMNMMDEALSSYVCPKSYDPKKPYDQQPFYRINPAHVWKASDGDMHLLEPNTAERAEYRHTKKDGNYWGNGSDEFFITLKPGEYWVMGDNRKGSKDSRVFGPIKRDLIHGHILFRIWSMDSDEAWWIKDLILHPIDFWTRVRWCRFFDWIYTIHQYTPSMNKPEPVVADLN
jgi:signal peptidase I